MSQKANLLQAIRDYRATAQHIGSAKSLLERLAEVEQDIRRLPDPVPTGSGDVPPVRGGERPDDAPAMSPGGGHTIEVHIHNGQPAFPDKKLMAKMMKGD